MVIVLLDTNIWISAILNPDGFPAALVAAWKAKRFEIVVSAALVKEVTDVLKRSRIRSRYDLEDGAVDDYLQTIIEETIHVETTGTLKICRDPKDDLILETAILGEADYLVSRDGDIRGDDELIDQMAAHGVAVISVNQMWEALRRDEL